MENIICKTVASVETNTKAELIRFMMNNLHEPAILCKWGKNENITIIDFNQYACRFLGIGPAELKRKNIYEIFSSESIRSVRRNLNSFPDEGDDIWVAELLTKKRKKLKVEISRYKFILEGGIQILLSFRDISEFKEALANLATYKNFFEISESARKTGFWEYDLRSEKLWASEGLRSIFSLGEHELSVDDVPELQLGDYLNRLDNIPEGSMKYNKLYEYEFDICRISDNAVISIWSAAIINFYENKIFGLVQDESEQRNEARIFLEEMTKSYDKNRSKQEIISCISNEIYAPMNRIVGYCELLNQPHMKSESKDNFIEYINKSCSHLHKLISDILDISRIEEDMAPFQTNQIYISELLNETLIAFKQEAAKKNLDIRVNPGNLQKDVFVISDESKLVKVISNLMDNAIRFTLQGYIEFGVLKKGPNLEFYVKDTGVGMSDAQINLISELFYSADTYQSQYYSRKGLGLALSKYYVNLLGGTIRTESKLGEGSTFYFTIPFTKTFNALEEIITLEIDTCSENLRTCLVLDCLEANYFYLKALLSSSGFRVLWAKDNDEAIYISIIEPVDILVIDKKSTDYGYSDTIKIIRGKRPHILIMAQIEDTSAIKISEALTEGVDHIISKPVRKEEFIKRADQTSNIIA